MDKKILLHVENRYLKGIFLKSIASADMDVLDIIDIDDLKLKLNAFGSKVYLAIFEINDWNMNAVKVEIEHLNLVFSSIPILAVVSKDTADVISFAMRAGIRDVLLLPQNRELYMQTVDDKMGPYYANNPDMNEKSTMKSIFAEEDIENMDIKESLNLEIKRAHRGGYSLSFIMAHLIGGTPDLKISLFQRIKTILRDTDKVIIADEGNFIGVFPFTPKENLPVIEVKFREAFEEEFGKIGLNKKFFLFTATFPDDDTDLNLLIARMENGISNSMLIDTIKTPLNSLSKSELENYKQKIQQYKKFGELKK